MTPQPGQQCFSSMMPPIAASIFLASSEVEVKRLLRARYVIELPTILLNVS